MAKIEDFNQTMSKFQVHISRTLREISRQRASPFGQVGSGRFIVLNDSTSPKMIMKMYFNFILKIIEPFECHRGNP